MLNSSRILFFTGAGQMRESRVGSRGELFLPKEIRKELGLHAHTKVTYKIEQGRLIVEPVLTLRKVLGETPSTKIPFEEVKKTRRELSRNAEKRGNATKVLRWCQNLKR